MHIDEYFEQLNTNDIRLKGTRVGIESILYEYIHREQSPEAILKRFPSITLEQIYATILYYLHNKTVIDDYMTEWLSFGQRMRTEQAKNPPPVVARLRQLKQRQQKSVAR